MTDLVPISVPVDFGENRVLFCRRAKEEMFRRFGEPMFEENVGLTPSQS
jgi:hypothetical protein